MLHVTYLIILLPLVGFAVQVLVGRRLGDPAAGVVATAFVGGVVRGLRRASTSTCSPCNAPVRTYTQNLWTWIPVGGLQVHARLFVDPLSMTMVLFVTGISTLIHLYSIGVHEGRPGLPQVLPLHEPVRGLHADPGAGVATCWSPSSGWEGVGACSYWLVSFWFTRDSAASAGKKAFIYNRIGDVGFLLAIFLTFEKVHSLEYQTIFANIWTEIGPGNITAICLLLLVGRGGQVGPDPPVPVAGRRHGGPDPGLGPDPRRHHGHRRRLPAVPDQPAAARLARRRPHRGHRRRGHRLRGRHHRLRPAGHQEGAGLLDRVPARATCSWPSGAGPTRRPSS